MDDPRNPLLEDEYAAAADGARRTVAASFDLHEVGVASLPRGVRQEKFRTVWRVQLGMDAFVSHLLVAVPWVFPDELPDIFSPKDLIFADTRIPHLDSSLQVCTLDDTTRFPNPELAGEAVVELINHAAKVIRDGMTGVNRSEYWDEFEAYWIDGAKNLTSAISTVLPQGPHRRVAVVTLSPKFGHYSLLFAEADTAALDFLGAIDRLPSKLTSRTALYLHLDTIGDTPDLRTNADVYRRVPSEARWELLRYLKETERPAEVLFSIPAGSDRIFGAWVHNEYATHVYRGKKSHRLVGQAPGFRPGHLSPEVELSSAFGSQSLGHIIVHRADPARLTSRTVGGNQSTLGPVNVVGCGSIGGFIAQAIGYRCPSTLRLVDPENLEVHNIPRHICDFTNVGQNKAHSVRSALRRSDPHLVIETFDQDVREVLRTNTHFLTPAQFTFVATANLAVERRINDLSRRLDLGTVGYIWVEPHNIAGHAVVVPARSRGCFECLLGSDLNVKANVLERPGQFDRRDAGCRGSFVPYGGPDIETFVNTVVREIVQLGELREGAIITWIGNLDRARHNNWAITTDWALAQSYSVYRRPIIPHSDCRICSKV
jgi:molybdopterin/thiamine biosynthesis adenylyltransferase